MVAVAAPGICPPCRRAHLQGLSAVHQRLLRWPRTLRRESDAGRGLGQQFALAHDGRAFARRKVRLEDGGRGHGAEQCPPCPIITATAMRGNLSKRRVCDEPRKRIAPLALCQPVLAMEMGQSVK